MNLNIKITIFFIIYNMSQQFILAFACGHEDSKKRGNVPSIYVGNAENKTRHDIITDHLDNVENNNEFIQNMHIRENLELKIKYDRIVNEIIETRKYHDVENITWIDYTDIYMNSRSYVLANTEGGLMYIESEDSEAPEEDSEEMTSGDCDHPNRYIKCVVLDASQDSEELPEITRSPGCDFTKSPDEF